ERGPARAESGRRQGVPTHLHQRPAVVDTELRMPLHAQEAFTILDQVVGAEVAAGQYLSFLRQHHYLILMAHQQIQLLLPGLHPGFALDHLIEGQPNTPALVGLDHGTAQGPRHQLMTEADADQRPLLCPQSAHEIAQCLNPVQAIVDTELAAGDQPGVAFGGGRRQFAIQYPVHRQLAVRQHRAQCLLEHLRIITVFGLQNRIHVIRLQNTYLHLVTSVLWRPGAGPVSQQEPCLAAIIPSPAPLRGSAPRDADHPQLPCPGRSSCPAAATPPAPFRATCPRPRAHRLEDGRSAATGSPAATLPLSSSSSNTQWWCSCRLSCDRSADARPDGWPAPRRSGTVRVHPPGSG